MNQGIRIKLVNSGGLPEASSLLSEQELAKYNSFKIEKRRRDWLGGRLAAKTILQETFAPGLPLPEIEISYDQFGRPVWKQENQQLLLSITHSGHLCAAACGEQNTNFLGIDLEKAEPRALPWYNDYFHKAELPNPTQDEATKLWTLKEALLKALGIGLKADPLDINLAGQEPQFFRTALARYNELGRPQYKLTTTIPEPGFYFSACIND